MDGVLQSGGVKVYKSPRHAQVWFLKRSRDTWKNNCMLAKQNQKRLENRVRDTAKAREKWAEQARAQTARVKELEAENAALKQELEVLKKVPDVFGARPGR